jgi:hypothetical protein
MRLRNLALTGLLAAAALVSARESGRTTARDTRVPAVANAAAFSVW